MVLFIQLLIDFNLLSEAIFYAIEVPFLNTNWQYHYYFNLLSEAIFYAIGIIRCIGIHTSTIISIFFLKLYSMQFLS